MQLRNLQGTGTHKALPGNISKPNWKCSKPRQGWLGTSCGREEEGKEEDSCYKYRVISHGGKLASLFYAWGIEEIARSAEEMYARVSGRA